MVTLIKGDALEKMKAIGSKSVDLIICDLPYGCLNGGGGKEKEKRINNVNLNLNRIENGVITGKKANTQNGLLSGCAWDIKIDLDLFWKEVKRIRKNDHTPCIHFTTTKFGFDLYNSNPKEFRYDLVWDKQRGVSFLLVNKMPMRSHEMIYVFSKAGANYNRIDYDDETKQLKPENLNKKYNGKIYGNSKLTRSQGGENGKRCVNSVIINKKVGTKSQSHPTEKPLDLYKFLIERYSKEGDTVLDPTFGSGNSGKACQELKRKYIGIEKDQDIYWKGVKSFVDASKTVTANKAS